MSSVPPFDAHQPGDDVKTLGQGMQGGAELPRARVLVVDDDRILLKAFGRILTDAGFEPTLADSGAEALDAMDRGSFDAVVSDIGMPVLGGLDLFKRIRARDLDVPVIFVTGTPSVETAAEAVEHGALRYLLKPVTHERLRESVTLAVRTHQVARAKRSALARMGVSTAPGELAGLAAGFEGVLESLWLAFQPIVSWSRGEVIAYEGLMRSREPSLPNPLLVLAAAERLGKLPELGREIRRIAAGSAGGLGDGQAIYVNLHPLDLFDDELFSAAAPLSLIARRVVLEITERALLEGMEDLGERIRRLRALGYRFAIDDLGAGYAGLTSITRFEPEIVKLDMGLVRDIDSEPTKQKLVRSMCSLCADMGTLAVAEGVETVAERDVLVDLGCDVLQGYLFATPGPAFPKVTLP